MGSKVYLYRVFMLHVLPRVWANVTDTHYHTLMPDRPPCHTSNVIKAWLQASLKFCDKILRPPSLPDLSPSNYFIWAYLQ